MRSDVERIAVEAVSYLIAKARGSCVTFTPKRVAQVAGLDTKPVTLSVVKYVLEKMRSRGLISIWDSKRKTRYIVTKDSPLWKIVKAKGEKNSLSDITYIIR
ncbi:MAG: DNA-binding protein [Thermoprotei archaeon]|nr:MAG: DNA-binding protein [Thermoprotei archaeon]